MNAEGKTQPVTFPNDALIGQGIPRYVHQIRSISHGELVTSVTFSSRHVPIEFIYTAGVKGSLKAWNIMKVFMKRFIREIEFYRILLFAIVLASEQETSFSVGMFRWQNRSISETITGWSDFGKQKKLLSIIRHSRFYIVVHRLFLSSVTDRRW